jgi:serine/threonine-protein kinase
MEESRENKGNDNKKGRLRSAGNAFLFILAAFTLYFVVSLFVMVFMTKSGSESRVPDVVGKKFIDVYNILERQNIRPRVTFRDVTDLDDGIILSQYPESGSVIRSDSSLRLTVSRSAYYVETPNLVGLALPIALNKVKNLHYQGRPVSIQKGVVSYISSEKTPQNIVLGQSPLAGERITPDRKVNLLVSAGDVKSDMTMPDLKGQNISLAYDLLMSMGVRVRETCEVTGEMGKSGTITGQHPFKGSSLKKGDTVKLQVAYYPLKDHPYTAVEKVEYRIPEGEEAGLYEAYVEDNTSRRVRFSANLKPGDTITFCYRRQGNARIEIVRENTPVKVMTQDVE